MKQKRHILATALLMTLTSCEKFDVHPYALDIKGERDINKHMIERIEHETAGKDTLRVAVISDSHEWYNHLGDAVEALNGNDAIDFLLHCGDITDVGSRREMEWTRDILSSLRHPYVVLIGNHDFLGTGRQCYEAIFGDLDFSFIAGGVKFVCLNTNAGEYNYLAAVPDLAFMEREALKDTDHYDRTVVAMHVPPFDSQFNCNVNQPFRDRIAAFRGPLFAVFGHRHNFSELNPYDDSLAFYGVCSIEKRAYRLFTITPSGYEEEIVEF